MDEDERRARAFDLLVYGVSFEKRVGFMSARVDPRTVKRLPNSSYEVNGVVYEPEKPS